MYDIVILGGGPGGYVAADRAAALGLKTALIERDALGGTCLNRGCIPTKSLLAGAKTYRHAIDSAQMGVTCQGVSYDLAAAMAWKAQTVSRLVQNVEFMMKKRGVEVIRGTGRLTGASSLAIAETGLAVEGRHIVVASGSEPARPPIPGVAGNPKVVTSDELLAIDRLPESIVVIGGGVIGIEFAAYFSALGVKVTVIEMLPEILPFMDAELAAVYKRALKGVTIATGATVTCVEGGSVRYRKGDAAEETTATGELVLLATGRRPVLAGIGLEAAGVDFSPKGVKVDDSCRTNVPGVWAIGDATGRSLLAHSASAMGRAVAELVASGDAKCDANLPWKALPWVVYGDPEAAGVGMTEAEALAAGYDAVKSSLPARANGRFVAERGVTGHGLCKLVADKASGRLLGAHIVAPYAGEMIWGMQYAIARGATIGELERTVFPHPTVSELFHDALSALEL
ncbi:MAG TPA: dihydrolipoyl dehydrogenase [Spirochaetales bacterium]|nr:dihydrolipoyl dehydrogenase [Spirochaetales bacterium]